MAGSVEQIFIVPHSGETPIPVGSVRAHAGRGLEGDRNFSPPDRWIPTGCAITLIEAVLDEHGIDLMEGRPRRQVVTRGVRLNDLVGKEFRVGSLRCRATELCEPCLDLQAYLGDPRTIKVLVHRAGVRGDILDGGELCVGDPVGES